MIGNLSFSLSLENSDTHAAVPLLHLIRNYQEYDIGALSQICSDTDTYRLIEQIGRGGTSIVWLGVRETDQTEVALKFFSPLQAHHSAPNLASFISEAVIGGALNSPHIAKYYDIAIYDRHLFLVREYVRGVDHTDHGEFRKHVLSGPLPTVWEMFDECCCAVQDLHEHGYVCRDTVAGNFIFSKDGVKLTDLGSVRPATIAAFGYESLRSSLVRYLDEGHADAYVRTSADFGADVRGLGCILYYLLTGVNLFSLVNPLEQPVTTQSLDPANTLPGIDEVLRELIFIRDAGVATVKEYRSQINAIFLNHSVSK